MYIKDGKVSACKVVYDETTSRWISNPTEEMLLELGWEVYIPEVVEEEVINEGSEE